MRTLWDRLLIWGCCSALLIGQPIDHWAVVAMLLALTISALSGYLAERSLSLVGTAIYSLLAVMHPEFRLFLPLVYYDLMLPGQLWWMLGAGVALFADAQSIPLERTAITLGLLALTWLIKQRGLSLLLSETELRNQRDSSRELSLHLERQHQQLVEKQDYEIRLATLNERNRIAREIHDQVGHLLSRSLLQTAALMVTTTTKSGAMLNSLHDTLAQAMDSIRNSVHDLHEDSVDLRVQIKSLVDGFLFCPISLDFQLDSEPEKAVQYCLITAVKEGLHNITRHSDATQVSLTLLEHPAFYQLVLQDNGSRQPTGKPGGLGLSSMAERVQALRGQFSHSYQSGFRIFISIPKGVKTQ